MKPPYKVPSMAEIEAIPWNGYKVISTFSGCGGSCLGYRMAGYKVLWASEFIPAAQEVYKLNHPHSMLDTRDIRQVKPQDILDAIRMNPGELDLMDGSPPCASFSTAGKREAGWGKVKQYSDTRQRTDDLFFEYTRLLKGIQPKVFVAENVSGLVKGTAKGYFKLILQELKDCGYNVKAKVLDAQWLGVPQMRQRVIFIGVRNDLGIEPVHPKPLDYQYTVKDALPHVTAVCPNSSYVPVKKDADTVTFPTILQSGANEKQGLIERQWLSNNMRQWWENTPVGQTLDKGRRDGGTAGFTKTKLHPDKPSPTVMQKSASGTLDLYLPDKPATPSIAELRRICAFPDDFQLTGSFAQQWERLGRAVPPVMMFHIAKTIEKEVLCKL